MHMVNGGVKKSIRPKLVQSLKMSCT